MRSPPAPWLAAAATLLLLGCGSTSDGDPAVEVQVTGVGLDPRTDSPVILLQELHGHRTLPIWIGTSEARSIAIQLERLELPRPNTHDLAKRLLSSLDAVLERVVVTKLEDNTYFAVIELRDGERLIEVDARPSDAIALGLRMEAPIYVREDLLAEEQEPDSTGSDEPELAL